MFTRILYKNDKGYGLIELMSALAILAVVITLVYQIYNQLHRTWLAEDVKAELQQSARIAMDSMVREMMMMGYGATDDELKISIAHSDELEFKEYFKGSNDLKLYFIKYKAVGNKLYRYEKEYDTSAGMTPENPGAYSDMKVLAENVESITYKYFLEDALDTELDSVSTTADLKLIRRITVKLKIKGAKPIPGSSPAEYNHITLSADISPRNMWEGEMTLDSIPPAAVADLKVIDTRQCPGQLNCKWPKSPEVDVVGYLIRYGQSAGNYTTSLTVTIEMLEAAGKSDNPEYPITVDMSQYDEASEPPVTYFVNIQAYDRSNNYSPLMGSDVSGNPTTDVTNFTDVETYGDDTTCNMEKPSAPSGLQATSEEGAVKLTWQAPAMSGLQGYRVFRCDTSFTASNFPLQEQDFNLNSGLTILQVANEDATGNYPPDRQLGPSATTFVDDDPKLIGCTNYYYAICAVGCDKTVVWANGNTADQGHDGRYSSAQYATTSGEPGDTTPPSAPDINAGTQPGWKRVFLQHTIPADQDYAYTRLYYEHTSGSDLPNSPPPGDPPLPTMGDPEAEPPIPASPSVPVADVDLNKDGFIDIEPPSDDMGSVKTTKTIVFNHLTNIQDVDAEPKLPVNSKFRILAVAFDKCGRPSNTSESQGVTLATLCDDEPPGAPSWPVCNDEPNNVYCSALVDALNAATWTSYPASTTLKMEWQPVNKGAAKLHPVTGLQYACPSDPGGMVDFQGYAIRKGLTTSFTPIIDQANFASVPAADRRLAVWEEEAEFNNLLEGSVYYFCIQAADCYFWSRTGAMVESINISPENALPATGIKPGKLDLFRRPSVFGSSPEFFFATTAGANHDLDPLSSHQFHNNVTFYLQNTSLSDMVIKEMVVTWEDPSVALSKITFGPTPTYNNYLIRNVGSPTVSGDGTFASVTVGSIDFPVTEDASDSFQPSRQIPVTFEFKTAGGVVNDVADMRNKFIVIECKFGNNSIKDIAGNALVFTTGAYKGTFEPLVQFNVSEGAKFYSVVQNTPAAGTEPFEVDTFDAGYSGPVGYPEVNGAVNTLVTANVNRPSNETIKDVTLHYVKTDPTVTDPSSLTFDNITTTRSANEFSGTIPGEANKGAWYYLEARTHQGNVTRKPKLDGTYYYFRTLNFDPCLETPMPPDTLEGDPTLLKWSDSTKYVSGSDIDESQDNIKYDVYRRVGLDDTNPWVLLTATPIDATTFTDSTYGAVSTNPVVYYVIASNSCASPGPNESAPSPQLTVCPVGGGGCAITATPADIYAGSSIDLSSAVCTAANNGLPGQTGYFTVAGSVQSSDFNVTESGDTGTVSKTITTSQAAGANMQVVPVGTNSDTLTVTLSSASCAGITATVHVYIDPHNNTPNEPTGVTGSITGSNATINWSAVTQNTDNSPVTYTAGTLAGDSIVSYEVWKYFSETAITPPDPRLSTTGWNNAAILPNTATTSGNIGVAKKYTYFVVRAVDTVGQGTFSWPAVQIYRN